MAIISRTNLEVLNGYTSRDWGMARDNLGVIRRAALDVLGYMGVSQCLEALRPQVATVTFLAESGTSWINSLPGTQMNWDRAKPRCLYPVEDVLAPGTKIPIGVYNLRPLLGLGSNYIVWSTHEQEIDDLVNMSGLNAPQYFHQSDRGFDKPLGHGDAMLQLMPYVSRDIKYVIANSGGDVNSRETIETSLMVLAAMQKSEDYRERISGILPTACVNDPIYRVKVGDNGLPTYFVQQKLQGDTIVSGWGQSNIGVRIYRRDSLQNVLNWIQHMYRISGSSYKMLPGNEGKENTEFGLDHVDARLAHVGLFRTLAIASELEVGEVGARTAVKEYGDIESFLIAQAALLRI